MVKRVKQRRNKQSLLGFTLIELLVVIAIIGVLASVVLVSLNGARVKARDAKRAGDLKQINTALELYNDDNGHYPIVGTWACFDCVSYIGTAVTNPNAANITAALSSYMSAAPKDPKNLGGDSGYLYYSDGTNYKLMAWRTPENMKNYGSSLIDTVRCGTVNSSGQCSSGANTVGIWNSSVSANY
ncbi:MAG: prepilin-type N-terminal cleavage/methylation domain-containing protein [bacterium]|nr:prepilin-type N-terminal cleavage/methylation domain-containing protein [bacterium]